MNDKEAKRIKRLASSRLSAAIENAENESFLEERRAFLDKFILCEITCKTYMEKYLQSKKKAENAKDRSELKLDMRIIPSALEYCGSQIDCDLLTPIFGTEKKASHRSCKTIRNAIVHSLGTSELQEMHKRYSDLIIIMDRFLAFFNE